jgi:hypothetical protein
LRHEWRIWPGSGEHYYHAQSILKTWRVVAEHKNGAGRTVAEDAHSRPNIYGSVQSVAAGGNKTITSCACTILARFEPAVAPEDPTLVKAVENALR